MKTHFSLGLLTSVDVLFESVELFCGFSFSCFTSAGLADESACPVLHILSGCS